MGCAKSTVQPPTILQGALPEIQQISVPVRGYRPVSPTCQRADLTTSSSQGNLQTNNQQVLIHFFRRPNVDGVSNPLLTDPRLLAMATFDFSGQKTSAKRKLDKQSVSTDIANLSNKELERINNFLNFLDKEELMFKRPDTEVNDIKVAVGKAVDSFGKYISETYPLLAVSHKHAVGSFAEGTRLKEPDEFDFILVLKDFNERNVIVERCTEDCTDMSDVKPHAHIKIEKSEWWNAKATEPDKWQDNGRVCNWLKFIDNFSFTWAQCKWNVEIETQSGTLANSETDLKFTSHGPAFTFELRWKPKQGKSLNISIDASLALERRGVTDVIDLEDVQCQEFIPDLLKENMYFVLYGGGKDGFKYTFTTTEVKLMQKISASHRQCYRILKFFFKHENCGGVVESYILKTLLLRHANSCTGNVFLFKCLNDVLDKIEDLYKQRTGGVRTVFLPDVKKNIVEYMPQIKLSRFVIFIQNELMRIGKSLHSDNSTCLGQLQMAMIMNVANEITE